MKVALTPHHEEFIGKTMERDYLSLIEAELRSALQSPIRKYRRGHFARIASRKSFKNVER
jgi:hypothetical protein